MFYCYILENPSGKFYIGHTEDRTKRLASHNDAGVILGKFTRKNGPWTLVWSEEHESRSAAMKREKQIKSMKSAVWIRRELLQR